MHGSTFHWVDLVTPYPWADGDLHKGLDGVDDWSRLLHHLHVQEQQCSSTTVASDPSEAFYKSQESAVLTLRLLSSNVRSHNGF